MKEANIKTLAHIRRFLLYIPCGEVPMAATVVLLELNVPTMYVGFGYLKKAVEVFSEDPSLSLGEIYARVRLSFGGSISEDAIDHAIRRVIKKAWKNKTSVAWFRYFSQADCGNIHMPTNLEFISKVGRVLELFRNLSGEEVGYE